MKQKNFKRKVITLVLAAAMVFTMSVPAFATKAPTSNGPVYLAQEIQTANADVEAAIKNKIDDLNYVTHEQFKQLTKEAKVIIRTGEITPYANIILQSGVIF